MKIQFFIVNFLILWLAATASAVKYDVYTNYTQWLNNVGQLSLEDFSGYESRSTFMYRDFDDFTITLYNQDELQGSKSMPRIQYGSLYLQEYNYASYLRLQFDSPISYIGFDWTNSDQTWDNMELEVYGGSWTFGTHPPDTLHHDAIASGFFGIIAKDGNVFNYVDFSDTRGNGGALHYGTIDNIRYESNPVPIPESASILLLGLGLLGLAGVSRKKLWQ